MLSILTRREQPAVAEQPRELSSAEQLANINSAITAALAEQQRHTAEAARLRELAEQHDASSNAGATAEAHVIQLHARRASGETVSDTELATAEQAVQAAHDVGRRAAAAAAGARQAADSATAKAASINTQLAVFRQQRMPLVAIALAERAERARTKYTVARDAFEAASAEFLGFEHASRAFAIEHHMVDPNRPLPARDPGALRFASEQSTLACARTVTAELAQLLA